MCEECEPVIVFLTVSQAQRVTNLVAFDMAVHGEDVEDTRFDPLHYIRKHIPDRLEEADFGVITETDGLIPFPSGLGGVVIEKR